MISFVPILIISIILVLFLSYVTYVSAAKNREENEEKGRPKINLLEIYALIIMPILGFIGMSMVSESAELIEWAHLPSIVILTFVVIAAYFASRTKHSLGPILLAILPTALLAGIILFVVMFIHFIPGLVMSVFAIAIPPLLLFTFLPILALLQAIFLLTNELFLLLRYNYEEGEKILEGKNGKIFRIIKDIYFTRSNSVISFILTFPIFLTIVQVVLLVFGQQMDSTIMAFVQSHDMLFSKGHCEKCSSPDHSLCVVAATGTKKLVQPQRYGIRKGEKFLLTRQLMICNAFEERFTYRFPETHRLLRKIYDRIDIKLVSWGKSKTGANIIYIATKPMEWFFLLVLYLFEKDPETLINRQYIK